MNQQPPSPTQPQQQTSPPSQQQQQQAQTPPPPHSQQPPLQPHHLQQQPQQPNLPCFDLVRGGREEYLKIGVPLYEASIKCNWKAAEAILDKRRELVGYSITENGETPLHVAASAKGDPKRVEEFVKNLVGMMTQKQLELQNKNYNTALYLAAAAGNVETVKIMVKENRKLLTIIGSNKTMMPLYAAALFGNKDVVAYIYEESKSLSDDENWSRERRGWLLEKCVENNMFDVALKIAKKHPLHDNGRSILRILRQHPFDQALTTPNMGTDADSAAKSAGPGAPPLKESRRVKPLVPVEDTPVDLIPEIVNELRRTFASGAVKPIAARKRHLRKLLRIFNECNELLSDGLYQDLHKHRSESRIMEIDFTRAELIDTLNKMDEWAEPVRASKSLPYLLDKPVIRKEPKGVVLIIAPWNYPITLLISPLIGALAAGNAVVLKPSECAGHTASVITELFAQYMDPSVVRVVNGGVKETTVLLEQRWDHIFYTGNGHVGQIVMAAAAKHLTPLTLELGGKSPCFVDKDSDLTLAAKRIAWGKCVNAGQTCVAPDYILCHPSITNDLLKEIRESVTSLFGDNPRESGFFPHIINEHHFDRLSSILHSQLTAFGASEVVQIGELDRENRFFPFTALKIRGKVSSDGADKIRRDNPVMQDELFGPILPIIEVDRVEDGIDFVNFGPTPLALYVFSRNPSSKFVNTILDNTKSGGVCVNDTIIHLAVPDLPFGGSGPSGFGAYHGKHSFDAFSHHRSALIRKQSWLVERLMALRYAPYTERKANLVKMMVYGISDTEMSFLGRLVARYWWTVLRRVVAAAVFLAAGVAIGRSV